MEGKHLVQLNGSETLVVTLPQDLKLRTSQLHCATRMKYDNIASHQMMNYAMVFLELFESALSQSAIVALLKVFRHSVSLIKTVHKSHVWNFFMKRQETYENDSMVRIHPFGAGIVGKLLYSSFNDLYRKQI